MELCTNDFQCGFHFTVFHLWRTKINHIIVLPFSIRFYSVSQLTSIKLLFAGVLMRFLFHTHIFISIFEKKDEIH